MTMWARNARGPAQPLPAQLAGLHRGPLRQVPADGLRAHRRARRGHHGHHRLPVRRGADPAAAGPVRRGAQGRRAATRRSSARRTTSSRSWTTACRSRSRVRDGLLEIGQQARHPAAWSPTTRTTPTRPQAEAHDVLLCVQTGSNVADPNRFQFDGAGYFVKSRRPDARGRLLRGCGRRAAATPCWSPSGSTPTGMFDLHEPDAALPGPRGRDRGVLVPQRGLRGAGPPLPGRHPGDAPSSRPSTSSASSSRWASRPTSWWSPTSSSGPRTTASRSARAVARRPARWSRTRWASPTSTRSPHGLIFERFLNPERVSMPDVDIDFDERRRGEVIRYVTEQVGRGQGRADRHLRHDQGEGRDQGLGPGARLPVRGRRPDHQGHAAGRDGQGHPARPASSTTTTSATARPARSGRCTTQDPDVKKVIDTAAGHRGPDPADRRARRRRHHVAPSRSSTTSR